LSVRLGYLKSLLRKCTHANIFFQRRKHADFTEVDANCDGIDDTTYVINENNMDRYPLVSPFSVFDSDMEGGEKN
jgi:hypothetical protein